MKHATEIDRNNRFIPRTSEIQLLRAAKSILKTNVNLIADNSKPSQIIKEDTTITENAIFILK